MTFENISFTFNSNFFILIPLLIFGIAYTYFIYRFTIPTTSFLIKTILFSLRSISLILIITILFEPSLNLNYSFIDEPQNILFIDNSSSIVKNDSLNKSKLLHTFISDYKKNINGKTKLFTFGKKVTERTQKNDFTLKFDEQITNFENIAKKIDLEENVASVTILSDGIINDGTNSYSNFEKLGIPINTIAIGDTIEPSDISIKKVSFNKLIYVDKPTEIKGVIHNYNLANRKIFVTLYNSSSLLQKKQIKLNKNGINNVLFNFKPKTIGKQKLTIKVSEINEEKTYDNNSHPFIINVLNDKIKVLLLAGAPSADLSTLSQSLSKNKNIKLSKIIQITKNKFLGNDYGTAKLDSTDIIVMIDFPTSNTPQNLLNNTRKVIATKQTPFFLILSQSVDYKRLSTFDELLPFSLQKISREKILAQLRIKLNDNTLINNAQNWQKLSPIYINTSELQLKSSTTLIASGTNRTSHLQYPLLFSSKIASHRSIVLNGINFWKWNLQSNNSINNLFNHFIANTIKWLYADNNQKRIFVNTSKDIYSSNETIIFAGNVYDETLSPRNDATITINVKSNNFKKSLKLSSTQNGKYEGEINITQPGDYNFTANIAIPGESTKNVTGKFSISQINLENINFVLNSNYLKFISNITSGKSFNINNYSTLFNDVNRLTKHKTKKQIIETKYDIWTNQWTLVLIIFLFAIEWLIRKRKGML